jgi:hypothetical protein
MRVVTVVLLWLSVAMSASASQALDELDLLDVGVVIFDVGVDADREEPGAYPRVRSVESTYLPVTLRQVLVESAAWGVVRVLPQASALVHLTIETRLVESTGLRLQLQVRAGDATGAVWLDQAYVMESAAESYPVADGDDPFLALYQRIAADLMTFRASLSDAQLRDIRRVAFLRYAGSLSPDAFAGYLQQREGRYAVQRLPAEGDDMVARVERIRNQEYLFIDSVDEQYTELQRDMAPAYNLWRQYDREQIIHRAEYQARVAERDLQGKRGSFSAMQQVYNQYKVAKIQEQDVRELATGFDNETAPTVLETDGRIFSLAGTLDSQYREWRQILRQIFALETGLTPGT